MVRTVGDGSASLAQEWLSFDFKRAVTLNGLRYTAAADGLHDAKVHRTFSSAVGTASSLCCAKDAVVAAYAMPRTCRSPPAARPWGPGTRCVDEGGARGPHTGAVTAPPLTAL